MVDQSPEFALSPLDQIRRTEAEVTRQIAVARERADQILKDAQRQAAVLRQEAREAGAREGQARYRVTVSKAEEEAIAIIAEAKTQAKKLRRRGQNQMPEGVRLAVNLIIGKTINEQET